MRAIWSNGGSRGYYADAVSQASGAYGTITSANPSRQMQHGIRPDF